MTELGVVMIVAFSFALILLIAARGTGRHARRSNPNGGYDAAPFAYIGDGSDGGSDCASGGGDGGGGGGGGD